MTGSLWMMMWCVCVTVARRRLSANGDDYSARHQTHYGYDCQLLTTSSRPAAVGGVYAAADHNASMLIAQCDVYRNDGLPGAKIFSPCPTSTRWIDDVDEDAAVHNSQVSKAVTHTEARQILGWKICVPDVCYVMKVNLFKNIFFAKAWLLGTSFLDTTGLFIS